ncbi:hypothetical protein L2E82_36479 [Cichorium intybus]|uniref:Uncharacterized protein n=1 Tax=Cichorium intybus TaxID=13427 RepID=A0ACB9BRL8_CICIN|nr:hypothetical protein L2E82_36479 [Cichorium intybus]
MEDDDNVDTRGCKVGAATSDEFGKLGKTHKPAYGTHDTSLDCFSHVVERFWKKNQTIRKNPEVEKPLGNKTNVMHVFLPEDMVKMCLMSLPLMSLMNTRLVCKKWRSLTTNNRFLQMRKDGFYPSPWLFLFGTVKDGYSSHEIYAFDVSFKKWHKIETEHKVASMRHARSKPVLGVYEVNSDRLTVKIETNPPPPRVHEYSPQPVSCGSQRLFLVAVSWCEGDGEIGRRNKAVRKLWELDLVYLTWN